MPSNPYAAKPGDERLTRGSALIEHATISDNAITLKGQMPTPCHELRVSVPVTPDSSGRLNVEVWSVVDTAKMCAQMLQPFSATISLPNKPRTGVLVNGNPANQQ